MTAPTRARLPVRLPAWMETWPEGIRPSAGFATVDGVELLLVGADGRWALIKAQVSGHPRVRGSEGPETRPRVRVPGERGSEGPETRTLDIDATLAARADLVAHAIAAALRRSGAQARQWLQAQTQAVARIEAGTLELGALTLTEIFALIDDRIDDPEALRELAERSDEPAIAAAVLVRLVARAQLEPALRVWSRFEARLQVASEPASRASAAMMLALTGDGVAALELSRKLHADAGESVSYHAAGVLLVALREHAAASAALRVRARLERSLGAYEHAMIVAGLAGEIDAVIEAAAHARALAQAQAQAAVDVQIQLDAMLQAGAYDEAQRLLEHHVELDDSASWRAQLAALWLRRGDHARADADAEQALAIDNALAEAHAIRGGAAVLAGDDAGALVHLDRALELEPHHQAALLWRAQARLRTGPTPEARSIKDESDVDRDSGRGRSPGQPSLGRAGEARAANDDLFAAPFDDTAIWQLLFALVRAELDRDKALHGPLAYFHRALVCDLFGPAHCEPAFADDEATLALLWRALGRFAGSRTPPFSILDDNGQPVVADALASTQAHATRVQHRLLMTPIEQVLDDFAALAERYGESPHPQTYTAELELWRGDYERAWALTDQMWQQTGTRWAYIGSGAALGLLGRFDEALERWATGGARFSGFLAHEATYCYRGEVYRLLGRIDEACADLEQAVRTNPTRLGAWINLALVRVHNHDADGLELALDRIDELAPLLIWEASRVAGLNPAIRVDRARPAAVLEQALLMMRGNRSSVMHTFVDARGRLRVTVDQHLSTWQRWATSLNGLPGHGLGAWLLERGLEQPQ